MTLRIQDPSIRSCECCDGYLRFYEVSFAELSSESLEITIKVINHTVQVQFSDDIVDVHKYYICTPEYIQQAKDRRDNLPYEDTEAYYDKLYALTDHCYDIETNNKDALMQYLNDLNITELKNALLRDVRFF